MIKLFLLLFIPILVNSQDGVEAVASSVESHDVATIMLGGIEFTEPGCIPYDQFTDLTVGHVDEKEVPSGCISVPEALELLGFQEENSIEEEENSTEEEENSTEDRDVSPSVECEKDGCHWDEENEVCECEDEDLLQDDSVQDGQGDEFGRLLRRKLGRCSNKPSRCYYTCPMVQAHNWCRYDWWFRSYCGFSPNDACCTCGGGYKLDTSIPDTIHACASASEPKSKDRKNKMKELADVAGNNLAMGAVQGLMEFLVNATPAESLCGGTLTKSEFDNKKENEDTMSDLGCGVIDTAAGSGNVVNLAFSFNYRGRTPGFCAIAARDNGRDFSFSIAMNPDGTSAILEKMGTFGKLAASIADTSIGIGISTAGGFHKQVNYWNGDRDTSTTVRAHAYLRISSDLNIEAMLKTMRLKKLAKYAGNGFVSIDSTSTFHVRVKHGTKALDCFIGSGCSESNFYKYLFDNEFAWENDAKIHFNFDKMLDVLPKISVDLRNNVIYKNSHGLYFTWKFGGPGTILKTLLEKGAKALGFNIPNIPGDDAEFKVAITKDMLAFKGDLKFWSLRINMECKIYFQPGKKDPVHCKFNNKFLTMILDFISDVGEAIGKAAEALYLEVKDMAATTGKVVSAGARQVAKIGSTVVNGISDGVEDLAEEFAAAAGDFLGGKLDWCDCGNSGQLEVRDRFNHRNRYFLHPKGNWQVIMWGYKVSHIEYRCSGQGRWDKANFSGSASWTVKYWHERKDCVKWKTCGPFSCCKCPDRWHTSGRIRWK